MSEQPHPGESGVASRQPHAHSCTAGPGACLRALADWIVRGMSPVRAPFVLGGCPSRHTAESEELDEASWLASRIVERQHANLTVQQTCLLVPDCFYWIQTRSFDCGVNAENQSH